MLDLEHPSGPVADGRAFAPDRLSGTGTLAEQVYAELRQAIVRGLLKPRTVIPEPELASQFEVSRTPVREALLRLRDDGLVVIRKQSGTFVAPIESALVEEGILVREALEPRVVAAAAERLTSSQIDQLARETGTMERSIGLPDRSGFIEADDRFHSILIAASGHRHIARIIAQVNAQLDRVRYLSAADPARAHGAVREHEALIEALKTRDGTACAALLASHLTNSWPQIRNIVAEL